MMERESKQSDGPSMARREERRVLAPRLAGLEADAPPREIGVDFA